MATFSFLAASAFLVVVVFGLVAGYYLSPPREIRGIPTIPFWVALLPLFKDVDQKDIFNQYIDKPLRKHGAVKIFFAAQWNVLVHRPSYLAEIFKREDIYQKSGNQKKIPHSVLASLLGDNIISSHGETWKGYQQVVKPGLQATPDVNILLDNAQKLRGILVEAQRAASNSGIGIQESIQRYTIANFAQGILNVDFGTMHSKDAYIHRLQYGIKREIFKPIFMNFPSLDRLGLPSRERARKLAAHFTDQLVAALKQSVTRKSADGYKTNPLPAALLGARDSGTLTEQQLRDNITVLFVAGQENTQLAILSTMYLLAKHPEIQDRLHEEVSAHTADDICSDTLQSMPLLAATVYESLRLLAPIGQLVNRRAAQTIRLGGEILIPEGTYLGYNCFSTNRDPEAWGADAADFRPTRWGTSCQEIQKEYRRRRARAEFISFHGGNRACLGERFAMTQIKATLYVLARDLRWKLDPTWPDRMTPAGPLCPRNLHLVFQERAKLG